MKNKENTIGLFPLRIFLLPGDQTTLHIYEPRYLQLSNECLEQDIYFGIPYQGKTTLSEYGSMVRILQVLKYYENGELDILVECDQSVKINQFEAKKKDKLYPAGTITPIKENIFNPNEELKKEVSTYLQTLLDKDITNELNELLS